jgi:hypothetical protein
MCGGMKAWRGTTLAIGGSRMIDGGGETAWAAAAIGVKVRLVIAAAGRARKESIAVAFVAVPAARGAAAEVLPGVWVAVVVEVMMGAAERTGGMTRVAAGAARGVWHWCW